MMQFLLPFIITWSKFLPLCTIFDFENWISSIKFCHFEKKMVFFSLTCIENVKNRTRIEENIWKSVRSWLTEKSRNLTFWIFPSCSIFFTYFTSHGTRISHFTPLYTACNGWLQSSWIAVKDPHFVQLIYCKPYSWIPAFIALKA